MISDLLLSESSLISNLESFGENEFKFIYDKIDLIFEEEIKGLRINFSFDIYEKSIREIRNLIIKLRKEYYTMKKTYVENKNNSYSEYQTKNNIYSNFTENQNNIYNNGSNTNVKTDTQTDSNFKNKDIKKFNELNNTTMFYVQNPFPIIISPKGINIIYQQMLEISNFLMSYEDIFINYDNKTAFITAKLFLQMATLHFIKSINKIDFILGLINKSCNILCQYRHIQKKDDNIKKILILEDNEFEKFKKLFKNDCQILSEIQKKIE